MLLVELHINLKSFLEVELWYTRRNLSLDYFDFLRGCIIFRRLLTLVFGHVFVHLKALSKLFHFILKLIIASLKLLNLMNIVRVASLTLGWALIFFLSHTTTIKALAYSESSDLAL